VSVSERGLLDTSTVILLGRMTDPSLLPDEPVISAITLAELSVGPLITDDPDERGGRQAHLQLAESDFDPLPFDAAAARAFGRLAAELRRTGRKPASRAYDALIAATAISVRLPLFTCNPSDFSGMPDLDLRVVPHPDQR
jgi:tRNA(fMet)-specific endonuclease VapC